VIISLGDETCFTAFSWEGVNWDVMRAMMSFGAGLLSPFVPSAQTREREGVSWDWREKMGIGWPIPYYVESV